MEETILFKINVITLGDIKDFLIIFTLCEQLL